MKDLNNLGEADLTYLDELAGGNTDFMREIIEMFISQTPIDLALLRQLIFEGDWNRVADQAHRIKPTLHYVGAAALREEMQRMENNARTGTELEGLQAHLNELQPRFDALITVLGTALKMF
ncbi:HPt (histidine-containing phosphotransfer) domain-containing protein [bacterium A37T11]|nr:HPt (histidine-containing phosphotransfer) domain-containing protein [bacterium A37T11]